MLCLINFVNKILKCIKIRNTLDECGFNIKNKKVKSIQKKRNKNINKSVSYCVNLLLFQKDPL
jgi:hypothetical protein